MHKYFLFIPFLLGCPPQPGPPVPDADAMVFTDASTDPCGRAEQHLLQLQCKDQRGQVIGAPNLHGVPWSQICRENKSNGVDMKPECLMAKTNCAGVESCR